MKYNVLRKNISVFKKKNMLTMTFTNKKNLSAVACINKIWNKIKFQE